MNDKLERFIFSVTVDAPTFEQARQVMIERVHHCENYGFPYVIDFFDEAETFANPPCRVCGSTTTDLHTNMICGNCYDPTTGEATIVLHWSDEHGPCYDCGLPAAFWRSSERREAPTEADKLCAVCAANAAVDGEVIKRI